MGDWGQFVAKFAERGNKNGFLNSSIAFKNLGTCFPSTVRPRKPVIPAELKIMEKPVASQPDIFNVDLTCKGTSSTYPAMPDYPYSSAPHPDAASLKRPPCCLNFGPNDSVQSTDNKIVVTIGVASRVYNFSVDKATTKYNAQINLAGGRYTEMSFTHISTTDTRIPGQPVYISLDRANIYDSSSDNWLRSPELIAAQEKRINESVERDRVGDHWMERVLLCLNQNDTKINKTWQKTRGEVRRTKGHENKQQVQDRVEMQNSIMNTEITMIKGKISNSG